MLKRKDQPTLIEQSAVRFPLQLMCVLLEYINPSVIYNFISKLGFIAWLKSFACYASIMLDAFRHLLSLKLCQHNRQVPIPNVRILRLRSAQT